MATSLFTDCNELTLSGIKNIRLMSELIDGRSIDYPVDFIVKNNEESTIIGINDPINQEMIMGGQTMKYVEPYVLNSSFEEVEVTDRRGRYYNINLTIQIPKLQLLTNIQIKEFIFDSNGDIILSNTMVIIEDNNGIKWIIGYDLPLVLENFEATTGGADNSYTLTYIGRSYNRIRRFEDIQRDIPTDFMLINETDFLLINAEEDKFFI